MARENTWGYKRIRVELLKVGITLFKGCIADMLRRNGLPTAPERKGLSWREFLSRHAETLLCGDLFTKEVWTFCGLRTAYVLFVLRLDTWRIVLAEVTFCPSGRWMGQMARNLLMECDDLGIEPRFVLHDRDALFVHDFDRTLRAAGVGVVKTPFRAPNANAHAGRWVLSASREFLDHLILFGLENLRRAVHCHRAFFNEHRPHQGIDSRIPGQGVAGAGGWPDRPTTRVVCSEFLGGVLKSYSRKAA